ncbi:hypothetical protein KR018_006742, partial [Drosophila ironensis]
FKMDWYTCMRGMSEFSATALLMLLGCMGDSVNPGNGSLMSSINHGMAVMVIIHVFGFVSGAHANPCVSMACYLMGYIASEMVVIYATCQIAGGFFGYILLLHMLPQDVLDNKKPGVCITPTMDTLSTVQVVAIEGLLTGVVVLGWCAMWDVRNGRFLDSVSLRMGVLVTACSFAGVQFTGASMNPVRTLVPAVFEGHPEKVFLQLLGQIVASIAVPFLWQNGYTPRYKRLDIPIQF